MAVKAGLTERMKKHVWMPEMKGMRKILRVSWTAKKTNEWVLNKAGVKRELLDTVKAKEASILWSHHEETRELPGETIRYEMLY